MYRLVHERSGYKCADEKLFIAKMGTVTVFRASSAGGKPTDGVRGHAAEAGQSGTLPDCTHCSDDVHACPLP